MKAWIKSAASMNLDHWNEQARLFWGGLETIAGALPLQSFRSYLAMEKRCVLDAGPDRSAARSQSPVRLLGFWNEAKGEIIGTVLILHGWEGCSHGVDTLSVGSYLNRMGFHTMRLNFRDHGNTHILNEGVFNGSLGEEMSFAASKVANIHKRLPFYIVGPSLGGNFAIRVAYRDNKVKISNLQGIVAVCPAMDPLAASLAIDRQAVFRQHFCRAWKKSLLYKSRIFHSRLDLRHIRSLSTVVDITRTLSLDCFGYSDPKDYYETYTITPSRIRSPACPIKIITSRNDPIITVDQFTSFRNLSGLAIDITESGGHVGYLRGFPPKFELPLRVAGAIQNLQRFNCK